MRIALIKADVKNLQSDINQAFKNTPCIFIMCFVGFHSYYTSYL